MRETQTSPNPRPTNMASYPVSLQLLLSPGHEFGESDSDVDRGWVKMGITQRTLRDLGYHREAADRRLITPQFIYQFYLTHFWSPNHIGELQSQRLANMLLGMSVNAPSVAPDKFQLAIRDLGPAISVDGRIGPLTISAANSLPDLPLLRSFISRMDSHYSRLAAANPSKYGRFLSGWRNRLQSYLDWQPPPPPEG